MKLYLNERPRTFIVTSDTHALIIRHPYPKYKGSHHLHLHLKSHGSGSSGSSAANATSTKVIVEFVNKSYINFSNFKDITPSKSRHNKEILGFLGLLNVGANIYLGFITRELTVACPTVGENINKIAAVDFFCLNNDEWDHLHGSSDDIPQTSQNSQAQAQERDKSGEYPVNSVRKLLSSGAFFYSRDFDVTSNVQERGLNRSESDAQFTLLADSAFFQRFMWNWFMSSELIEFRNRLSLHEQIIFDSSGFLVTITRGFAKTLNTQVSDTEEGLITIISKQACIKNGPLFGDWGCDDEGSVSNFVETELIIYTPKFCFAYVIVRGNVPVYWELENNFSKKNIISSKKSRKVVFPRSFETSQHAFTRHFAQLASQYGEVHIINSLSADSKNYKSQLNDAFENHVNFFNVNREEESNSGSTDQMRTDMFPLNYKLGYTPVPISTASMKKNGYNAANPHEIVKKLEDAVIDYGALFYDISKQNYTGKQLGIFRVNSFDNLSKANYISKIICQEVIELAFRDIKIRLNPDLLVKHAKLWSENEDYLCKITLNFISSTWAPRATSKKSVKSAFTKKYLSGVVDSKPSELAMLKLLGRLQDQVTVTLHNPIHDYVQKALNQRSKEYSSYKDISLFASTFNVNGVCTDDDIKNWIFPKSKYKIEKSYDVVFVGFQEIVELSAGQMVNTQSDNRIQWEKKIKKCLNDTNPENQKYVSLWNGQLGGIALLLFVKETELNYITNLEGSFKKTGLGGMSSNKGGVAVSFTYSNTEVCLVTSHLAAGLSNIDERHHNYKTIIKGIKFSKNRRIKDHDVVIWLGDMNYRIGLPKEQVKPLIEKKEFNKLFEYDQLNRQMAAGESFPFFDEMEIRFAPTYKFDNGTKVYDTSEKQRIPAWTDRILSRGKDIKQLVYDCDDDLIFSDHRPVYSIFKVSVHMINQSIKKNLSNSLYESYRKEYGGINEILNSTNNLSFLIDDDEKGLPAPSSESKKWWIDGGHPAKVTIPELNEEALDGDTKIINPRFPVNPFDDTDEPEFIKKSELMEMIKQT
ncbi:inositol-1,4,5-triphosphate 5-phosphatase [Suhomyces tanzawaensis NRRL Y-17324]|uniref:phosphoinositide 5-phosphatase n=1 Tax=Suhomyces tanzawaensis NRRL Y-17324 TaxID=984487 RepID=A0A1E4SS50_9ASCO|nr:inositol-1,4,5-triphosphate 5-phosphatase [Suhomyces tanzawaensis NRRL Y-17324]ODV82343.1 inositol-1,4,5-triphosphate 5-phosphatase [Suhomyces tanzawaensis NRRL Y-17324]